MCFDETIKASKKTGCSPSSRQTPRGQPQNHWTNINNDMRKHGVHPKQENDRKMKETFGTKSGLNFNSLKTMEYGGSASIYRVAVDHISFSVLVRGFAFCSIDRFLKT